MNAVDTNILFYIRDPRDPGKQETASALVQTISEGVLIWQVACEYISACKKLEPYGLSHVQAWQDIRDLRRVWTTVLPSWEILGRTEELLKKYRLSFWDAMIISACLEGEVECLYSEDFGAYSMVEGLKVINPFKRGRE